MKNQNTKPTKKKIVMYYLILAACLVVIASVTVGIVFAVRNRNANNLIDKGTEQPDDGNKPGDDNNDNKPGDGDNEDDKPTDAAYKFISPVSEVDLMQSHVFGYDKTLDRYRLHCGIDLKATAGTDVVAAVDGIVTEVSVSDPLFGAVITIEHADGVKTVYKFIDPAEGIKAGDKVSRGQVIGKVAKATGVENADGDHLHFEVYKNNAVQDPADYLDAISK